MQNAPDNSPSGGLWGVETSACVEAAGKHTVRSPDVRLCPLGTSKSTNSVGAYGMILCQFKIIFQLKAFRKDADLLDEAHLGPAAWHAWLILPFSIVYTWPQGLFLCAQKRLHHHHPGYWL